MDYPEHEKMAAAKAESQAIGEFLDWMNEQGIQRTVWTEEEISERNKNIFTGRVETSTWTVREWRHHGDTIETLLAKYFEIDLSKIEQEKRAMLAEVRALNGAKP